jgi:hypothetical protein
MQVGDKDSAERKRADEIYRFVIMPALSEHGLHAYRADLDPSPGSITTKLLEELLACRLVIADLTGRNPNVFYELGIVHSFARPLISIADSASWLPFDTKDERIIELGEYSASGLTYAQGEEAKRALLASLRVVLAENYTPPSPLREVAASRSIDQLAPDNPVAAELAQMRETLAEIRQRVAPRSTIPQTTRAEIGVMRDLIESLVEQVQISSEELAGLITDATGPSHDKWVTTLDERLTAINASKSVDDPWSNVPDPWGSPSRPQQIMGDEPPF